ncbi:MAG: FG-GAP repeat domain-containing protein [Dehalococcoidia bacterium]
MPSRRFGDRLLRLPGSVNLPVLRNGADRRFEPDVNEDFPPFRTSSFHMLKLATLPPPALRLVDGRMTCQPQWNAVALFYNFDTGSGPLPDGYQETDVADAREWLDEGSNPQSPPISEFLCEYWGAVSYGKFSPGISTPRDRSGAPLIPTVDIPEGGADDWSATITSCIARNAEAIWTAAGRLQMDGKRWIPSVVLIERWNTGASAHYGNHEQTVGGHTYLIGDECHLPYTSNRCRGALARGGRSWWGVLCHEFAHNFLEFADLYPPQGRTGYWDLLGDHSCPGQMSEISSVFKVRNRWIEWKEVIEGPHVAARDLSLQPYTTSGEAYKVVPDPEHRPKEYFVLEYRVSTGTELWRPDGGLPEGGLLIAHINERLGRASTWLLNEAPYFDPEVAGETRPTVIEYTGFDEVSGQLFPNGGKDSFTHDTRPSSRFYGGDASGLSITQIRGEGGRLRFRLAIDGSTAVGWRFSRRDRGVAGRFIPVGSARGEQILFRDDDTLAMIRMLQSHWFVYSRQQGTAGDWVLGRDDRHLAADFDGDGIDEVFVHNGRDAAVLRWEGALSPPVAAGGTARRQFGTRSVARGSLGSWRFAPGDTFRAGDVDGDGAAELVMFRDGALGLARLSGDSMELLAMHERTAAGVRLGDGRDDVIGRFRNRDRDDLLLRRRNEIAVLAWSNGRFRRVASQEVGVDGWLFDENEHFHAGDFDGDGLDEIYTRSGDEVALLKWFQGRMRLLWRGALPEPSGDQDRTLAGRFREDRDAVLFYGPRRVAVLGWDGQTFALLRDVEKSPIDGLWEPSAGDRLILGDFHRVGPDNEGDPGEDYVLNGLTDVFIHSDDGTALLGVNHGHWNSSRPNEVLDQLGITWVQQGFLLRL